MLPFHLWETTAFQINMAFTWVISNSCLWVWPKAIMKSSSFYTIHILNLLNLNNNSNNTQRHDTHSKKILTSCIKKIHIYTESSMRVFPVASIQAIRARDEYHFGFEKDTQIVVDHDWWRHECHRLLAKSLRTDFSSLDSNSVFFFSNNYSIFLTKLLMIGTLLAHRVKHACTGHSVLVHCERLQSHI